MILGEVGDEGGRLAISGPATTERRAAARRRRMIMYAPISMATRASPPITPVESGSMGLENIRRDVENPPPTMAPTGTDFFVGPT